jgi:hypothetical protein
VNTIEQPSTAYFATRLSYEESRGRLWRVLCAYLQKSIPQDALILETRRWLVSFNQSDDTDEGVAESADKDVGCHMHSCASLAEFPGLHFDLIFASNLFEHVTQTELNCTGRNSRSATQVCRTLTTADNVGQSPEAPCRLRHQCDARSLPVAETDTKKYEE